MQAKQLQMGGKESMSRFARDLAVVQANGFKIKAGISGFPVYIPKGTPIEELNLSVRASNGLKRAQIMTIDGILEKSSADLYMMRNMGVKSIKEIKNAVLNYSYDHMTQKQRNEFWKEILV